MQQLQRLFIGSLLQGVLSIKAAKINFTRSLPQGKTTLSKRDMSSSSSHAKMDRRSVLAERMGKMTSGSEKSNSNNSSSNSSSSNNNSNIDSNSHTSTNSNKTASSKPAAKSNESYLKTWLGNDMPGQSYLQQMVAASKAKVKTAIEANNFDDDTSLGSEKVDNPMKELIKQRQTVHLNECSPADSLQQLPSVSSSQNDCVSINSSSIVRATYEFTTVAIDLTQKWETVGIKFSEELPFNNHKDSIILEITPFSSGNVASNDKLDLFAKIVGLVKAKGYNILGISGDKELPINLKDFIKSSGLQSISRSSVARSDVSSTGGILPEEANKIINMSFESSSNEEEQREIQQQQQGLASKFYQGTVRSGQQIYAQDTGLIILGGVNDGGEVLADGDIHVYGPLSGRVIAGLSEDAKEAKIFIRQFRPSLIGIGDAFIIPDDHSDLKRFKDKAIIVSLLAEGKENNNGPIFDSSCVKIGCEEGKFLVFTPMASF